MFRDPSLRRALRQEVVPLLRTYPSLKVWVAGCSAGKRCIRWPSCCRKKACWTAPRSTPPTSTRMRCAPPSQGVFDVAGGGVHRNHARSGARSSLSDYYAAAYGRVVFDKGLREHMVFSDHSLATDSVFAEVHLVSCRNVLIYFERDLQDRAWGCSASRCATGAFWAWAPRVAAVSAHTDAFDDFVPQDRIYRKRRAAGTPTAPQASAPGLRRHRGGRLCGRYRRPAGAAAALPATAGGGAGGAAPAPDRRSLLVEIFQPRCALPLRGRRTRTPSRQGR